MASIHKRLSENITGDFYVDSTCIDCGTCRWMAPQVFAESSDYSYVYQQPQNAEQTHNALLAIVACPTASIGTVEKHNMKLVIEAFPNVISDNVYHCGYHHKNSFGAASYFIKSEQGNILIDSPRFAKSLVTQIEKLGGVKTLLLTHKDDVADHEKFAKHFGCERILHKADQNQSTKNVERLIEKNDPLDLNDDLKIIPTPGHTKGSMCFLYKNKFLFTGDHLAWNPKKQKIYGFKRACWYDWQQVVTSTQSLLKYDFEYLLPGHGHPCHFAKAVMKMHMQKCVGEMLK